jgi:hypothetical protein
MMPVWLGFHLATSYALAVTFVVWIALKKAS